MNHLKWTQEHLTWCDKNRFNYESRKEMLKAFNEKFNVNCSKDSMMGILRRTGNLRTSKKNILNQDMIEWIKKNYPKSLSSKELVDKFNKKFNTNFSAQQMVGFANNRKIKKDNLKETLGNITRNTQGTKIGSEYKTKNGHIMIKINNFKDEGKNFRKNWELKHRYVYEKKYGEIPNGYNVIFLDGNKENCKIENLVLATKKEILHLKTLKWYGKGAMTKAGLEVIRSEQILVDCGAIKRQKSDINRLRNYIKGEVK